MGGRDKKRNSDVAWDLFSPAPYKDLHYSSVRPEDHEILEDARDFFAGANIPHDARGIDAGTGPNLYPTLAMLPFCHNVTMLDISRNNIAWLERQQSRPDSSWELFWKVLHENERYQRAGGFERMLRNNTDIEHGDLFDLRPESYDVGTMFFVAESLSNDLEEFYKAVRCFIGSLKQGAPFVIAFMRESKGYRVNKVDYPAVAIGETHVKECLGKVAKVQPIRHIALMNRFRRGYEGMMLATGYAATDSSTDGGLDDEGPAKA